MTASDPFVSGTLDDISTTETGNWPKPAVTMDMVMDNYALAGER